MGDFPHLQINQHITFQFDIIENKVDKIIFCFCNDMLLSRNKSKSSAHFHKKITDMGQYCGFQIAFQIAVLILKAKKFRNNRTFHKLKLCFGKLSSFPLHFSNNGFLFRRLQKAVIILCADITVKHPHIPVFIGGFSHIPNSGILVRHS